MIALLCAVVLLPPNYSPAKKWPVVLFLHGAGERGSDNEKQMKVGLGPIASKIPAIIVFPQAPEDSRWIGEPADAAVRALDEAIAKYNGDPDRVYLTGLSMGGYGTWHIAMAHPDKFAALVVVCGGLMPHPTTTSVRESPFLEGKPAPYRFVAAKLKHIPIWIFHGAKDPVIPVEESRRMADELKAAGADVRYTEYPDAGHNAWDPAYNDPELWQWLLTRTHQSPNSTNRRLR